jgi:hypothetical protein
MAAVAKNWLDFALQQMAAESYLDQSTQFGGSQSLASILKFGANNPLALENANASDE